MIITFLIGTMCLVIWLYFTDADATAMRLLWVCLLYMLAAELMTTILSFGIKMIFSPSALTLFGIQIVLLAPVFEELAKLQACQSLTRPLHRFALVSLFGIYELMISKPFAMEQPFSIQGFFEAFGAIPALFTHILTAVVYAFYLHGARWHQLVIGIAIHATYNALVYFVGLEAGQVCAAIFIVSALALFPWKDEDRKGHWS